MRVTFLGTGTSQGVPIIGSDHPVCLSENEKDKRLRVSALLEWEDYTFVIDCGPDFRQQMIRANVRKLDGLLITHEHNDHIIGLDDVRPFYFRQGNIALYCHKRVLEELKKRFAYVFEVENKYPGAPTLDVRVVSDAPFQLGNKKVIPINVYHPKLQVYGYRFGDFAYITDAKIIPEIELAKLNGVKILVINALRKEEHYSHLNLAQALEIIKRLKVEKAYLTHISHHMGFHDEVQNELPLNVFLAYDGLQIQVEE